MALAAVVLAVTLTAAPLQRDLGDGLLYARVRSVPHDLPEDAAVRNRPCVLDLRYAITEAPHAAVLGAWLDFHAGPRTPVFVLINGSTGPNLQGLLARRPARSGVLTIGIAGEGCRPDIAVSTSAETESQAYEALGNGATVQALTTDNPDKQRNDEASLSRDATEAIADQVSADAQETKTKAVPIDAALQRAIQVHRALRALKKL